MKSTKTNVIGQKWLPHQTRKTGQTQPKTILHLKMQYTQLY